MTSIRIPLTVDQLQTLTEDYELDDMYCNIDQVFDDVRVLESQTASRTTQAIVKIRPSETNSLLNSYVKNLPTTSGPNAFLKLSPMNHDTLNKPTVEIAIYKYIDAVLIQPGVTPHLMKYVASAHCTQLKNHLGWLPNINKIIEHWFERDEDANDGDTLLPIDVIRNEVMKDGKLLIIELGQGQSLRELVRTATLSEYQLKGILFQIGYTLRQLHLAGIRHNDLHDANVWINILKEPREFTYQLHDGQYARIKTIYNVKIYDFDLSVFTNEVLVSEDVRDEFCPSFGICHHPDPLHDWVTVIHHLYTRGDDDKVSPENQSLVTNTVFEIVEDPTLLEGDYYIHMGHYCQMTDEDECDPQGTVPPNLIRSFEELWEGHYFSEFETDEPNSSVIYRDLTL